MERRYMIGDTETAVRVDAESEGYRVTVGERVYRVAVRRHDQGDLTLEVDGRRQRVVIAADGARHWVSLDGVAYMLEPGTGRKAKYQTRGSEDTLAAQMPGQVVAVSVQPGERVERGQKLLVLEAMKMELQVAAPHAGQVRALKVKPGDVVKRGQTLIELEQDR
ncbi:MAG: biotin/lipoyl-binding protein [Anaerolineae bacterium]|nr:biotin/lipoyl-binding protein [Anaerolineae bacterium]